MRLEYILGTDISMENIDRFRKNKLMRKLTRAVYIYEITC